MAKQKSQVWWKVLLGVAVVVVVGVIAVFATQSEFFQGTARGLTFDVNHNSTIATDQNITSFKEGEDTKLMALGITNKQRSDLVISYLEFECTDPKNNTISCRNVINLPTLVDFTNGQVIANRPISFGDTIRYKLNYIVPKEATIYLDANINQNLERAQFAVRLEGTNVDASLGRRSARPVLCGGRSCNITNGSPLITVNRIEEAATAEEPILEEEPVPVEEELIIKEPVPEEEKPIIEEPVAEPILEIVPIPFENMVVAPGDNGVILGGFELSANQQVSMELIIFTCAPGSLGLTGNCADYINSIYLYPSLDTDLFPSIDGPENVDLSRNLRFNNLAASPQGTVNPGEIVRYYIVADVPTSAPTDNSLAIELWGASVIAKDSNLNPIFASQIQNCDGACQFIDGEIHEIIIQQPTATQPRSLTFSLNDKNPPSQQMVRGYDGRINRYEFLRFNITTDGDGATIDRLDILADYNCALATCLGDSGDLQNVELWMFNGTSWQVVSGSNNIDPGLTPPLTGVFEFNDDFVLLSDTVTEMRVTADVSSNAEVGDSYVFAVDFSSLSPVQAIYTSTSDDSTVPPTEIFTDPPENRIVKGNIQTVSGLQVEFPVPAP